MICPNEDKLLAYVDQFLDEEETKQIEQHIRSCPSCAQQLEEMESEKAFLEETLKSPVLPDDFAEAIVAQVTPYKSKTKRTLEMGNGYCSKCAAGWGILMTVNPSLAEFVGGIFSSDQVDEGLQIAMDTDIATPVDMSVTDAGITLHVEHLIADTSRIALSYKVTDGKGKKLNPYFQEDREQNVVTLLDEKNEQVELTSWSWGHSDHYGIFEFSLVNVENFTKGTIQIAATEIGGKRGNWLVEIPVDLTAAYERQQIVEMGETIEVEDIQVTFNQVSYATSTTDISYSTEYNAECETEIAKCD